MHFDWRRQAFSLILLFHEGTLLTDERVEDLRTAAVETIEEPLLLMHIVFGVECMFGLG